MKNYIGKLFWVLLASHLLIVQANAQWQSSYYQDHPLAGKIYVTGERSWISEKELLNKIHNTRILLLGETHTNPDHHIGQARIIHHWMPADRNVALVMEMLAYDNWKVFSGLEMSTEELNNKLEEVAGVWKWHLYQPLVQLKQDHHLPMIGANLTREQRSEYSNDDHCKMSRGDIDSDFCELMDDSQQGVIRQLIYDAHCDYLPYEHTGSLMNTQIAKDASFALSLVSTAATHKVVLIAGAVHVRKDIGVPVHLQQLGEKSTSIAFINVSPEISDPEEYIEQSQPDQSLLSQFDYVYFTPSERNQDPCVEFAEQLKKMKKAK